MLAGHVPRLVACQKDHPGGDPRSLGDLLERYPLEQRTLDRWGIQRNRELRERGPRPQVVHGDLVRSQFRGQRATEGFNASFAGRVVTAVGLAQHGVNAGYGDDPAPVSLLNHLPSALLRTEEHAFQVGAEDEVPVILGHVNDLGETDDAGVVHQNVELAQETDGLGKCGLHLARKPHIAAAEMSPSALVADPGDHLFGLGLVDVEDDHVCPLSSERKGNGFADAASGACNDGGLVF